MVITIDPSKRVTLRSNPVMFDRVIQDLQQSLAKELPWLNHSFGRAERLVKTQDGRRVYTPNLYIGHNEYVQLLPDQGLGNFSFFVMEEPEQVMGDNHPLLQMKAPFSLIVWVDMRTVDQRDERNTEDIKVKILATINEFAPLKTGHAHINKIYTRAENVFNGFSLDEVSNQYMMAPFCAWRFYGEMQVRDMCREQVQNYLYVKPEEVIWIDEGFDYDIFTNTFWKVV